MRYSAISPRLHDNVGRYAILLTCALLTLTSQLARSAEKALVVKIRGYDGETSYDVKTPDEFKDAQKELTAEARLFPKAYRLADKRWKKETGKPRITRSAVSIRRITMVGRPYKTADEAHDKVMDLQARIAEKLIGAAEKEKKRNRRSKKSKAAIARERRREAKREADTEAARIFFLNILEEIKNPPADDEAAEKKE